MTKEIRFAKNLKLTILFFKGNDVKHQQIVKVGNEFTLNIQHFSEGSFGLFSLQMNTILIVANGGTAYRTIFSEIKDPGNRKEP